VSIRDAPYFARLLEALYNGLIALDVTGYREATSDGWTQALTPFGWTRHLEAWFFLGSSVTLVKPAYRYGSSLHFAMRFQEGDDSTSQARIHAAMRDASEYLLGFSFGDGGRVLDIGDSEVEREETGYVTVTIPFTLQLPR